MIRYEDVKAIKAGKIQAENDRVRATKKRGAKYVCLQIGCNFKNSDPKWWWRKSKSRKHAEESGHKVIPI